MTDMMSGVENVENSKPATSLDGLDEQLVAQLLSSAKASGLKLTGEGGMLQQLTKLVLESALEGEITDHLGYDKHDPSGRGTGNSRNGTRSKTVLTDVGPVEIDVPRDRDASFEPKIVAKRQRRLGGVDEMVISLAAKGLTTGEISAHLAEVYGAEVSRQTISTITDKVIEGMIEWQNRPLDAVYPVIFIDAIHVKIRDGQVANRPIYVALAVTCEGRRDILGLWAGDGGEGAKYWLHVLTELKNRGVADVLMVVRRADRAAGRDHHGLASDDHPDLRGSLAAQQFPLRGPAALGRDRQSPQAGLHRADRGRRPRTVHRVHRRVGRPVSGDRAVVEQRLGRVRAVPGVRPGDPAGDLLDQRHRERQRPYPPRRQGPRALSERAGRAQVCLHGDHEPGSDRHRPRTLDDAVETRVERVRDRLRRPPGRRTQVVSFNPSYTARLTDPTGCLAGRPLAFLLCCLNKITLVLRI